MYTFHKIYIPQSYTYSIQYYTVYIIYMRYYSLFIMLLTCAWNFWLSLIIRVSSLLQCFARTQLESDDTLRPRLFERVSLPRPDRSCSIITLPGQYILGHWRLEHNLLLDFTDARAARAAYLLRHNTMMSNYYIIIRVAGWR